jgi:hypothetical protein
MNPSPSHRVRPKISALKFIVRNSERKIGSVWVQGRTRGCSLLLFMFTVYVKQIRYLHWAEYTQICLLVSRKSPRQNFSNLWNRVMTSRPVNRTELKEHCAPLKHMMAGNIEVHCAETLKPVSQTILMQTNKWLTDFASSGQQEVTELRLRWTCRVLWPRNMVIWSIESVTGNNRLRGLNPWAKCINRKTAADKLVPTFADRGCHVVSVTDPYGRILRFLDRSPYFFFQVAPQLYSRGWVDPVPDTLLPRKSGSAGNPTRTSGSVARNSDH